MFYLLIFFNLSTRKVLFDGDQSCLDVRDTYIPFLVFDYVTIYHTKVKFTKMNFKKIKNFRIELKGR